MLTALPLVAVLLLAVGAARAATTATAPNVVADLPVPWSLTAQIMAGVAEPQQLVEPGTDPHDLQLRPSQLRLLGQADLVVWTGPDLLPPVAQMLSRLELTDRSLALLDIAGDVGHGAAGTDSGPKSDADDDVDHDDLDHDDLDHDDPGHEDGALHAWLDPEVTMEWVAAITARLSDIDPGNAGSYRANADDLTSRIRTAQQRAAALLEPVRDLPMVVLHDAYDPLADRFGLNIIGAVAEAEGMPSSARRLADLRRDILASGARCAFHEPHQSDALLRNISEGSGIRIATLDASGGFMKPTPDLYPRLLIQLAEAIATCQSGGTETPDKDSDR